MKVVLIGASGLVGSSLLNSFLNQKEVEEIHVVVRRDIEKTSDKLKVHVIQQMNEMTIGGIAINADIYVCALGTTIKVAGSRDNFSKVDRDYVVAFARAAKRNGAKSLFVVSAMGANKNSPIFYNRVKGEMEAEVLKLDLPSVYFLHPSLLIGNRAKKRIGEEMGISLFKVTSRLLPQKLSAKLGTPVEKLVNFVLQELQGVKKGAHVVSDFLF